MVPTRLLLVARKAWFAVPAALLCMTGMLVLSKERKVLNFDLNAIKASPTSPQNSSSSSVSYFQKAIQAAFDDVIADSGISCPRNSAVSTNKATNKCYTRKRVNFTEFPHKAEGGLQTEERIFLADLYYNVDSVFEFGIGESTAIAAATNLPRYTGVDSDAEWVSKARSVAPDRYRFYFADVGATGKWGYPVKGHLSKASLDYQLAPLAVEQKPFDVYLVDGRWRVSCVMASFLHALQTGGNLTATRVVLHDYTIRTELYGIVESIATIESRLRTGVALALKHNVTERELYNIWEVRSFLKRFCCCNRFSVSH